MLLKLSKGAKKVAGSGEVAVLRVDNWFQQSEHSRLCVLLRPLSWFPEEGGLRLLPGAQTPLPSWCAFPLGALPVGVG